MFYIKLRISTIASAFIDYLKEAEIMAGSTISRCMTARPANVLVALPAKTVILAGKRARLVRLPLF